MPPDLGTRFVCFQCGCRFYDLNRTTAVCPDCGADQADAPSRDVRSLLSKKGFLPSGFDANPKLASDLPDVDEDDEDDEDDAELLDYEDDDE